MVLGEKERMRFDASDEDDNGFWKRQMERKTRGAGRRERWDGGKNVRRYVEFCDGGESRAFVCVRV